MESPKAKPEPAPAPAPANPMDDVSAWIAQGASMLSKLSASRDSLNQQISALEEEALRIQLEVEEKQKERDRVAQMIDALCKMQSVVG